MHNSSAGDQDWGAPQLLSALERAGHDATYCPVDEPGRVEDALRSPGDLVVVAGGDGTVRDIAIRLLGRGVPLTLFPTGTANNIARSLGFAGTPEQLIAGWPDATPIRFDAGLVTGPWRERIFLEGVGIGPTVSSIAALTQVERLDGGSADPAGELLRDLRVLRELLADHPAHECRVTLDGRSLSGCYVLLEVMNIRSIGPNLCLAPNADASDGLLDLVLISDAQRGVLRQYLSARIEGHDAALDINVHRGRQVQVEWEGSRVHIDDEVWPHEADASASVSTQPMTLHATMGSGTVTVLAPTRLGDRVGSDKRTA